MIFFCIVICGENIYEAKSYEKNTKYISKQQGQLKVPTHPSKSKITATAEIGKICILTSELLNK